LDPVILCAVLALSTLKYDEVAAKGLSLIGPSGQGGGGR